MANTLFNEKGDRAYNGKGWIASLQDAVMKYAGDDIQLGVAFLSKEATGPLQQDNVMYYPIRKQAPEGIRKLFANWTGGHTEDYTSDISRIIRDFRPDLMQIFGCESKLASAILSCREIPSVIHIQGILTEYIPHFFPPGTGRKDMVTGKTFFNEVILNNGYRHLFRDYTVRAVTEKKCLEAAGYIMGRTEWDKDSTGKYSKARYFHVDEVLREDFYSMAGKYGSGHSNSEKKIHLISTISPAPYKGLDLILRTAGLLKGSGYDVTWDVIGISSEAGIRDIFEKKTGICASENGIRFLGVLDTKGLVKALTDAEIYVHPSYIENSPNSVCEAQMLGMPVIATDAGGTSTLVHDGEDGVIVRCGDPGHMCENIIRLHSDLSLRERIGRAAASAASERHDRRKIVEELKKAYSSILTESGQHGL